ncbi:MAG: hypothetical protein RBJ76_07595 [Stenomitos frigidus ULC029]
MVTDSYRVINNDRSFGKSRMTLNLTQFQHKVYSSTGQLLPGSCCQNSEASMKVDRGRSGS